MTRCVDCVGLFVHVGCSSNKGICSSKAPSCVCVQYKQTANYLLLAILACKAHYSIMSVGSLSLVHFHIVLPTLAVA